MRWQRAWAAWWDLAAERATSRSVEGPARADGPRRALEAYELEDRTLLSATPLPADLLAADLPADGGGDSSAATDGSAAAAEAADPATNSTTATLDDAGPNGDAAAAGDFDASAPLDPAAEDAPADGPAVELVFVQDSIQDLDQLLAGLIDQLDAERTLEVVVLDSSADGLDQVSQALAARRDVAAVHFVTHGADGMARLGGSWLDAATLDARFEQIERWAEALTDDADLVFYGCDLAAGEAGQDLVERLSALTGADVAASTDATGQAALGGDWDFEYRVGDVDTGLAFSTLVTSEWQGRLATYVVTNTNNSGAGSLRQAIIDANNNAGADTISFNIGTGSQTITLSSLLPTITGQVTIDGWTQGGYSGTPLIGIDGNNLAGDGLVLTSTADGSIIRGLVLRDFGGDGIEIQSGSDNNTIAGNYVGRLTFAGADAGAGEENTGAGIRVLGANNTIGGTTAANRNVVSGNSSYGILITGAAATGNVVSGNYVGLTAAGTATLGNSSDGVRVEASANNNTIGGSTTAHRNVISGNSDGVQLTSTSGNVVRNNYIGTDWTGTVDLGNTDDGVDLDSNATNNQILDNLISGNNSDGIDLGDSGGDSSGTLIRGNLIGTQANGTSSLANTGHGILIGNGGTVTSATIGGVNAGEGNTIAYNGGDGIYVSSGSGITIRGNSSFGNTGLAIDLGTNGVTVNDTGDGDTGANALQNFPVLTYAYTSGSTVVLSGSLNSTASGTFTIDFYSNTSADPTGYGEGSTYLGSTTVTTNGSGNATFSGVVFSASVSAGSYITATATNNATNNTSEFSLDRIAVTNSLWLSTVADVTGSGVPGLDAWDEGEVIQFGPPQFELQPANLATDGTLESMFDLNNFAAGVNIDALEYVTRTITIGSGGNTLTLQAGDVLLSLDGSATLTSSNSLSVTADEVFLFRPTVAGVYTSGTFTMVLDNFGSIHGGSDTWSLALVEQNTTIGDYTVSAGSFLFSRQGAAEHGDIRLFTPTGVGAGTTSGTVQKLVEGSDSGVGISTRIYGLELVETAITVGGVNLAAGTILMAVNAADTVGSNNLSVTANDVFAFTFSTTTLGSGTSSATASLLFDGSDVNLSSASENLDGLALFSVTNTAPTLSAAQSPVLTAQNEDSGAPSGAVGTLVSALVDFASPSGQVDNVTDPDAGALLGIAITAADTTNGAWFYSTDGGSNWNALGAVSSASARLLAADASTRVYFQPNANYNGTLSSGLTFRAWDRTTGTAGSTADTSTNGGITAFSTATDTASLTVNAVNDAPVHTVPGAQSVSEDGALVFSAAGGNLISINDVDAGSSSVQVTLTVTNGTLNLAGTTGLTFSTGDGNADATMTFTGSQTDVNAALASLSYSPTQNYTGAATLTVTTSDLGNSGSGGAQSDTDNVAITVNAVNDTPLVTTTGSTLAYTENNAATPVDPGLVVSDVEGTLTGATVTISSNYASGQDVLAFTNQLGITGSWDSGTGTLTLTGTTTVANYQTALRSVTYHNTSDAPSTATRVVTFVVNDGTVNSNAGAQSTLLSTGFSGGTAGFTYVDDPFGTSDPTKADGNHAASGGFTDGALRVYLGPGPNTAAVSGGWSTTFTVANAGEVIVSVRYRMTMGEGFETDEYGEVVLAVDGTRYGSDTNSSLLHVDGNDNGGGSENSGWRQATVRMNLTAGNHTLTLGAYNNKATASDEWVEAFFDDVTVSEASNVRPISVTAVNDAPVLDNAGTMTLTAITEDQTSNAGDTVASILASAGGDRVTDVDSGAVEGIALTATASGNGVWEYSTDGGSNWNAVGTVANNSALLLRATDRLRFVPDGLNADAASVSFRAWDQTSGTAGAKVDASTTGGTTAFSTATETASISVTAVNDAPTLNAAQSPALTAQNEDSGAPSGAVGTLVSTLVDFASPAGQVDNVTDPDSGALLGIAITAADTTNGVWFYSTDGGSNWNALGAISDASARLLTADASTRVYFQPNANYNGTISNAITFRAWDQTSGANGATADTTTNGGITAFSTATDTASLTISAVNDAPTATITPASYTVNEQTTLTLHGTGLSIADVDAGGAAVQATVSVVSGTLTAAAGTTGVSVSGSGTSSVTLSGTLTQINNLLAGASGGTLTYTLNSDTPPASDTLTLQASDLGNSGSGGTLTGSDTATINLTAVNDAPMNTVSGPQVTAEDTPLVFNAAGGNLISIGDVDAGGAAVQVTLSATGGTLTLSGTTGLTFSTGDGTGDASMQFSGTLVDVNAALNGLTFNPTPDFTGGAGIGIVTSDLGSTGTGGPQTDTDAISINVTAVNDPPTLGFPGPDLNYTENDGPSELDTTATVADIDSPDFATGTLTVAFTANGQAEDRLAVRHQGTGPGQVGVSGGNVTYGGVTVGSWSGGTSGATPLVVTFNANATAAVVQAVARAVTYENVSDTPSTLTRTWQATLTDGDGGTSTPVTGNIFLTAVNDVPVITSNGGGPTASVNVAENSTAVTTVTATDLDLPTQTLAYSISGGADAGRFTIDSGTGALSFSTAPDREAATDANGDHVYEVTVQVSDGAGGTDTQTLFVTVTDVDEFNVGPVSDANAAADLVAENAANGTLVGLTAQATDADATTSAITYSLDDSAGGRFTIDSATGVVTVANGGLLDYEAATSHDITVRATSADGSSSTRTFTIALGPVNDNAPVITSNGGGGSASVTVAENTTAVTTVAATDADLPAQTVSYSISGGADAGRFTIDSATGALTFSAPPDFENPLDADGDNVYEVTVQASDGAGGADTQNLSVSVSNTNEAPVATIGPATYAVDEQVTLTLHGTGLALADVDAGANPIQATVSVVSGTLAAAAGTTGVTVLGSGTSSVTLSGTLAQINDLLAGNLGGTLTYVLSSDTPPAGDTLTLQVNDQGHSGAGGPLTASDTAAINITALNDAPVNSVPGPQNMTEDGTLVFSAANGNLISVADVDVGAGTVQLTLSVTSGTLTLSGTTGLAFSAGDGSADAGMQFTGTLADVNAALAGLTYAPLANFAGPDQLTITVDDLGSTGSGGPQTDTDTVAIAVAAVNDAPTLSAPAAVGTAFQAPVTFAASLGRAILPGDVDAAAAAVEVRLAATHGVLSLGQPGAVTIVSGSASGGAAVVFQGTVSDAAQALEGLVYTPDATFRGAAQLQVEVDDLGNAGSGGPLTAAATVVIDVAPAAQRLTLVAPAQVSTTNFAALFSNASGYSLVVVDAYGEDALVTLSLTASAGQIVLSQSTGLVFLAGSGTPSAQVVVEGTLSAVNAALDGAQFLLGANLGTLDVSVVDTPRDPGPAHSAASQVMILQSLAPAPPPPPVDSTPDTDIDDTDDTLPDAVPLQGLLDQRDGPTTVVEFAGRSGPARAEGPAARTDVAAPRRLLAFANETLADGALTGIEWQPDLGEVLLLARGSLSTTAIAALDATGAVPWELLVSDVERGVAALGFDDWETGVVSVTAAASLGYVLWTVRAGTLLTSLFYAMPAWRSFDVLPVIDSFDKQPVRRQGSGPEHDLDLAGLVDRNLSLTAKN